MKKEKLILFIIALNVLIFSSCTSKSKVEDSSRKKTTKEAVTEKQVWMKENLNVDKFRNGDLIPEAKTFGDWIYANCNDQPAWCYYDFDSTNNLTYGKLYNWCAVNDPRGLAPNGYHIPTHEEWEMLITNLGNEGGKKMKSYYGWQNDGNGNDEIGFSALPGGMRRDNTGSFFEIGAAGYWWSSSKHRRKGDAWAYNIRHYSDEIRGGGYHQGYGLSVRCLLNQKNKSNSNQIAKNIKTAQIGDKIWMVDNLNVAKFQNGDVIPMVKTEEEWEEAGNESKPACCFYKNSAKNGEKFGRLYNYWAIIDKRGLVPLGWRVASDKDWCLLEKEIGLSQDQIELLETPITWEAWGTGYERGEKIKAASKLKKLGNKIQFAGFRAYNGTFIQFGEEAYYFSPRKRLKNNRCMARCTEEENICRAAFPAGSGMYIKLIKK